MIAARDFTLHVQVLNRVAIAMTEEGKITSTCIGNIKCYRMTVTIKCAMVCTAFIPTNAQVGSDVGSEHSVHPIPALGCRHHIAELLPVAGVIDREHIIIPGVMAVRNRQ